MRKMTAPEDTNSINIGGDDFTPDENGQIEVPESHVQLALQLGCVDPDAAPIIPVMPSVSEEALPVLNEALVTENEGLKADLAKAEEALKGADARIDALTKARDEALELAEGYGQIVDGLRGSISSAREALTAAGHDADAYLPVAPPSEMPPGATERPHGGAGAGSGAESGGGAETGEDDALPRLDEQPDFDGMEYNPVIAWIKGRKVAVPSGIRKPDAIKLAKQVFADQKAAQDEAEKEADKAE